MHAKVCHNLSEQERTQVLTCQSVFSYIETVRQITLHKRHHLQISFLQVAPRCNTVIVSGSIILSCCIILVRIISEDALNSVPRHISRNALLRSEQKKGCVCNTYRTIFTHPCKLAASEQFPVIHHFPRMSRTIERLHFPALLKGSRVKVIYCQTFYASSLKEILAFSLKQLVKQLWLSCHIHIRIPVSVKKAVLILIYRFAFGNLYYKN